MIAMRYAHTTATPMAYAEKNILLVYGLGIC